MRATTKPTPTSDLTRNNGGGVFSKPNAHVGRTRSAGVKRNAIESCAGKHAGKNAGKKTVAHNIFGFFFVLEKSGRKR